MTRIVKITKAEFYRMVADGIWRVENEDQKQNLARWIISSTTILAGYIGDELICTVGIVPSTLLSKQAKVWMWTTDAAVKHEFTLVRQSQRVMKELLGQYDEITGYCAENASRSQRWLRWLGAEFSAPEKGMREFLIRRR